MESFFLIYFLQQIHVGIFFHTHFYLEIIEKLLLHTNIEFIL